MYYSFNDSDRPNRVEEKNKDNNEDYHLKMAKWAVAQACDHRHAEFIRKTSINKKFYKGDQWVGEEDLEAFLKDETGETRNRIKVTHNIIRPMVEQYRGNAVRMTINYKVKSVSKKAINRREEILKEKLFFTDLANEVSSFGEEIRKRQGVGKDRFETEKIFSNVYVDKYVDKMNMLLKYSSELNKFDEQQIVVAENLSLSGLGVVHMFEHSGHLRSKPLPSENYLFDRSAKEKDLSDSEYMGKIEYMGASDIFEMFQNMKQSDRKAIEDYVKDSTGSDYNDMQTGQGSSAGRIPVFHMYWKDVDVHEYGYVIDEYGYPYLTKINHIPPGEEEPTYTDSDLIEPPSSPKNRRLFKNGAKKRKMVVDVLRECVFIPSEVVGRKDDTGKKVSDIPLKWGMYDHQETDSLDIANVKYPFKAYCWGYIDGEIFSPVDDAINPQRFINRILSVAESQINNSGGVNVVIDKDAIDAQDGEEETLRAINNGKPVTIRSKGRGVPNMIGGYDASPKAGTYNMFGIVETLKKLNQDTTGINEGLQGQSTGPDQLVGVTQLLIQRGSLMQEPFYYAITNIFNQVYQYVATIGKRIYIDNERELAIATGDEGVEVITLSKDLSGEDFRTFVKRENADELLQGAADQQLMLFLELGLIDKKTFGDLLGRSTPDEVNRALRKSISSTIEAERLQLQQQNKDDAQIAASIQQQQQAEEIETQRARAEEKAGRLGEQNHELDVIQAKTLGKIAENRSK